MRGYEELIDRSIYQAAAMAEQICRRPEFELLLQPEMNVVLYRYLPPAVRGQSSPGKQSGEDVNALIDAVNAALHKRQRTAGTAQVSRTLWTIGDPANPRHSVALRAVLCNPGTTQQDIAAVLDEQVRFGDVIARTRMKEDPCDG
jgi:glutamate decarboxylase